MSVWIYRYPLLCWRLPSGDVIADVVGEGRQLVGADLAKLRATLAREIARDEDRSRPIFKSPELRFMSVSLRPSYRVENRFFAVPEPVRMRVAAVHGDTPFGARLCILPPLGVAFHYHDSDQLKGLIEHYTREHFHGQPPEEAHSWLGLPEPWLEVLPVRVREKRDRRFRPRLPETPTLEAVAERISPRTAPGSIANRVWERGDEVRKVMRILSTEGNSLLLVGSSGCGKTAILSEAIRQLARENEEQAEGVRTTWWRCSARRITAQALFLGDWEEACDKLVEELEEVDGVLWVDDFPELLQIGGEGVENSVASYILRDLQRDRLRLVGEMKPQELEAAIRHLPGFVERLEQYQVPEMSPKGVQRVMGHFAALAEQAHGVRMDRAALETAKRILGRFVRGESLPGKAMRFLSEVLNGALADGVKELDARRVVTSFARRVGLAELFLNDDLLLDVEEVQAFFGERIIGQEEAVQAVVSVVEVLKTALNDPERPVATFLFAGPTGVGKTAMTKALASYFFGAGQRLDPLVRLDMSEYRHPAQVARLLGDWRGNPGSLIREVRERPFAVVLFDEIEKAAPEIYDLLLTLMDEGTLVDAIGRVTDFRNTIIVMTSNVGVRAGSLLGFEREEGADYRAAVEAHFRPEFVNRLDHVVSFRALSPEHVQQIARKELRELSEREGFVARGLGLTFENEVVELVAREGFDKRYGARPLQRAVERLVAAPLAAWMVAAPGVENSVLRVTVRDDGVEVKVGSGHGR